MRKIAVATLAVLIAVPAFAAEPKTEDQKTMYSLGYGMGKQLSVLSLTPEELDLVKQGLTDSVTGKKALVDYESYRGKLQALAMERRKAQGEKLEAQTKAYVEQAAKEKGAVKTPSGLIYQSLKEGSGESPKATDRVKVNYRGTFVDGREFDSSYASGQPAEFELNRVIKCWTEGLQLMKPGGKARLVCPPDLAYGPRGSGMIPPNATLVFEVELLNVLSSGPNIGGLGSGGTAGVK